LRLAAWQNKIGQTGIPERFHTRSFENFVATDAAQTKALDFCKRYADQFHDVIATGRSAIFIGKPGTGKTHLAAAIGLHVMRQQNRTVLFTTVMRAIRRVKDSWDRGSSESESQVIQTFVAADLLILDEVGVQFGTEFEKNILFDVINERYEKRKPTILMSNLPVSDVTAYLGERVIDRIREDGGARIVFDWSSHRAKMQGGI
jgi:DNA replication protein DnaC